MSARPGPPCITGISPHQGTPGTQITIRGENLGENPNDLIALIICGTDCLVSAKWKSSTKLIARLGQAKRGVGDIVIVTRLGGRGLSNVQFRVFIEQVGPLQESSVWVDESRTVPGRNVIRNIPEVSETDDVLGLQVDVQKKLDPVVLAKLFQDGSSGNRRMETFNPACYLLENHKFTKLADLRQGLKNLQSNVAQEEQSSKNIHKSNLSSLINCVDALAELYSKVELKVKADKGTNKTAKGWSLTGSVAEKISDSKRMADKLFRDVLSRKDHADATRNALSVLTRFRFIFFLAESIDDNMAKGDYSTILNDYARAKALFKDTEQALFREVMVVLDEKIDQLKLTMRRRLMDVPTTFEEQSKLIKYLKLLDPESDPCWECITSYHCWLEDQLWKIHNKYHHLAVEEQQQQQAHNDSNGDAAVGAATAVGGRYREALIAELLTLLGEKLQSFWKLSQSYSSSTVNGDEKAFQVTQDQMLLNTINVSSWLMLNALVPTSLPESVRSQYGDQFAEWPRIQPSSAQTACLFSSLKALRSSIRGLLACQFTATHVQPLVELSMTIRLKCLGCVVEKCSEAIRSLGARENWKMDLVGNQPKTSLCDLYETELNDILPNVKQILSYNNFPGEVDLFIRERVRQMIIDLFVMLVLSVKDCFDKLLQLRSNDNRRPNALMLSDSASVSSAGEDSHHHLKAMSHELSSRKLLMAICNVDYIINHSLPVVARRFGENQVKFAEVILKKAKQRLSHYCQSLIHHYIALKAATITLLIEPTSYAVLPEEEDVTDLVKEQVMGCIFVQAELYLIAPQLTRQVLTAVIQSCLEEMVKMVARIDLNLQENATQVVIDLVALEDAFKCFISPQMRATLNSIRASLKSKLDQESFQASMHSFRRGMKMAIESLSVVGENESEIASI